MFKIKKTLLPQTSCAGYPYLRISPQKRASLFFKHLKFQATIPCISTRQCFGAWFFPVQLCFCNTFTYFGKHLLVCGGD